MKPNSKARPAIIIGGMLLLALPIVFVAGKDKPPTYPQIVLPTGETLSLEGVTFGTRHIQPGTPRLLRIMPPWLRSQVAKRLTRTRMGVWQTVTTATPTLKLWFRITSTSLPNAPTASYQTVRLVFPSKSGVIAGEYREIIVPNVPISVSANTDFTIFPRRSPKLEVLILPGARDATNVIGHWEVRNPAVVSTADWEPEALPASRKDKDLQCTLYQAGLYTVPSSPTPSIQRIGATAGLALSFEQQGVTSNRWMIASVTARDSTGNNNPPIEFTSTGWSNLPLVTLFSWAPCLWPDDTWELQISAKKTVDAQFDPGELVIFEGVEQPRSGVVQRLRHEAAVGPVKLRLVEFLLKPAVKEGEPWFMSDLSYLKVFISGGGVGTVVDLIRARDNQGNLYPPTNAGLPGAGRQYYFRHLPVEPERLSFVFAVQTARLFTFRVRPEIVTNGVRFNEGFRWGMRPPPER